MIEFILTITFFHARGRKDVYVFGASTLEEAEAKLEAFLDVESLLNGVNLLQEYHTTETIKQLINGEWVNIHDIV